MDEKSLSFLRALKERGYSQEDAFAALRRKQAGTPEPYFEGTETGRSMAERMRQDKIRTGGFMEGAIEMAKPGIEEIGRQYRADEISGLSAGVQTGIRLAAAPISRAFTEAVKSPFVALAGLSPQTREQSYGEISQDTGRALEKIASPVLDPVGKVAGAIQQKYPVASSYLGTAAAAADIAGVVAPASLLARGSVRPVTAAVGEIKAAAPVLNPKTFKALNPSTNTLSRRRDFSALKAKAALADDTVADLASQGIVEAPIDTSTRAASHAQAMKHVWDNEVQPIIDAGKLSGATVDLNRVADRLESMASEGRKTASFSDPAVLKEYDGIQDMADAMRKKGSVNIGEAEAAKQFFNSRVNNWGASKISDTEMNAYKLATREIGDMMDSTLSKLTDTSLSEAKRKWGALRETYEDALKADIVNQRRKGLPIEEAYGRMAGASELLGGLLSVVTRGAPAVGEIASGTAKVILGKYLASLKDADTLIRNGFQELIKNKAAKNVFGGQKATVVPKKADIFAKAEEMAQEKRNSELAQLEIARAKEEYARLSGEAKASEAAMRAAALRGPLFQKEASGPRAAQGMRSQYRENLGTMGEAADPRQGMIDALNRSGERRATASPAAFETGEEIVKGWGSVPAEVVEEYKALSDRAKQYLLPYNPEKGVPLLPERGTEMQRSVQGVQSRSGKIELPEESGNSALQSAPVELAEEAKKYDNVDEFIKNTYKNSSYNKELYHQTNEDFKAFDKDAFSWRGFEDTHFFSLEKPKELIKKNLKEAKVNVQNVYDNKGGEITPPLADKLRKEGYDAIISDGEIAILGAEKIKTREQLTDIWNSAHSPKELQGGSGNSALQSAKESGSVAESKKVDAINKYVTSTDEKINAKLGHNANIIGGWYDKLKSFGEVEVGWRASAGKTDQTQSYKNAWDKLVKKLEDSGMKITKEPVKHGNAWATLRGGFWNSDIYRVAKEGTKQNLSEGISFKFKESDIAKIPSNLFGHPKSIRIRQSAFSDALAIFKKFGINKDDFTKDWSDYYMLNERGIEKYVNSDIEKFAQKHDLRKSRATMEEKLKIIAKQ